jgi:alkane 1-monooxygenase
MTTVPVSTTDPAQEAPPAYAFAIGWLMLPMLALAGWAGGGWVALVPLVGFGVPAVLDRLTPLNRENPNLAAATDHEQWTTHRIAIVVWPFLQLAALVTALAIAGRTEHFSTGESFLLFIVLGTITGAVGIVHAHELMHKQGRLERFLGDVLMAMTLYSHFRTSHLHIHHRYVATPRDVVTARYGENFYAFLWRILPGSLSSAWRMEAERLRQRKMSPWSASNPFWTYFALQAAMLLMAFAIAGGFGVLLFLTQAVIAIIYLEATNYIEHYGLMRREIAPGRYEPVALHHSWDSAHRFTNYLLINLPRHPDHHYRPDRDYQLLQTYRYERAPQMPHSYPVMVALAFVPPVWMRMMNPRVRKWRARFQTEATP